MTRKELLAAAEAIICQDREGTYGKPEDNFGLIAKFWACYLASKKDTTVLDAKDVAMMMALLKIARIATGAHKDDSYIDLIGYAACGGESASKEEPPALPKKGDHCSSCIERRPACPCHRCRRDRNNPSCCGEHNRACMDTTPCPAFVEDQA